MPAGTILWQTTRNFAFAAILVVMLVLSVGVMTHYRNETFRVKVGSASAFSDMYAKLVAEYVVQSNSLPATISEIDDYLLGESTNNWYKTINASKKQFLLGQRIDSTHAFEACYEISATGLVRQSSQIVEAKR